MLGPRLIPRPTYASTDSRAEDGVEDLLRSAVASEGQIGRAVLHHLSAPGKRVRSRLAMASGQAVGAPEAPTRSLAAACELIHEASLVHDDVQDQDDRRRGQPTVWARYGIETAISVGDLMINQSFGLLLEAPTDDARRCALARLLSRAVQDTVAGQGREEFRARDTGLSTAEYFSFAAAKTGNLLALPVTGALVLAKAGTRQREAANEVMMAAGTAYQVQDDLMDLHGLKTRKRPGADLIAGKMTYPIILFRDGLGAERRAEFVAFMASDEARADERAVERWRLQILASPAMDAARETILTLRRRAEHASQALPRALQQVVLAVVHKTTNLFGSEPSIQAKAD